MESVAFGGLGGRLREILRLEVRDIGMLSLYVCRLVGVIMIRFRVFKRAIFRLQEGCIRFRAIRSLGSVNTRPGKGRLY